MTDRERIVARFLRDLVSEFTQDSEFGLATGHDIGYSESHERARDLLELIDKEDGQS